MTAPIPGPPKIDFTITYGADLIQRIGRRDKTTEAPVPYPTDATAFVRLGGKKQVGESIPCEIDEHVIVLRIESTVLDALGPTEYQLIVSTPGTPSTEKAVLAGKLVR